MCIVSVWSKWQEPGGDRSFSIPWFRAPRSVITTIDRQPVWCIVQYSITRSTGDCLESSLMKSCCNFTIHSEPIDRKGSQVPSRTESHISTSWYDTSAMTFMTTAGWATLACCWCCLPLSLWCHQWNYHTLRTVLQAVRPARCKLVEEISITIVGYW